MLDISIGVLYIGANYRERVLFIWFFRFIHFISLSKEVIAGGLQEVSFFT